MGGKLCFTEFCCLFKAETGTGAVCSSENIGESSLHLIISVKNTQKPNFSLGWTLCNVSFYKPQSDCLLMHLPPPLLSRSLPRPPQTLASVLSSAASFFCHLLPGKETNRIKLLFSSCDFFYFFYFLFLQNYHSFI